MPAIARKVSEDAAAAVQVERVLLLTRHLNTGGASFYTLNLARGLRDRGVAARVVCAGGAVLEEFRAHDLDVSVLPGLASPWSAATAAGRLRDAAKGFAPQVIHAQTAETIGMAVSLARSAGARVCATVHAIGQQRWRRRRLQAARVDGFIAVSDAVREDLVNRAGIPRRKVQTIHNGVYVSEYRGERKDETPPETPVIGMVGGLVPAKGYDCFLRAAAKVISSRETVHFLVVGDGPEDRVIRRLSERLGITEKVTILRGAVRYREILPHIDLFVLSSLSEGFGFVILEALACARPVIASGVGGVYSVVREGETGALVPRSDPSALADRILHLLDNWDEAIAFGRRGRACVEQSFNAETTAGRTVAFYASLSGDERR